MDNSTINGVQENFIPSSNAFTIEVLDSELVFNNDYLHITNIIIDSHCVFVDNFKSMNKIYCNILVNINIRIDYIDTNSIAKYQIFKRHKTCSICTDNSKINKNIPIYAPILSSDILKISTNNIYIYILFVGCIESI